MPQARLLLLDHDPLGRSRVNPVQHREFPKRVAMNGPFSSLTTFPPARHSALERLAQFVPHAGADYAALRNSDFGPDRPSSVSRLSPYLRYRLITEAEVVDAVLDQHSFQAAEKFIQEVLWRTYWKGWLELRPEVWLRYENEVERLTPLYTHDKTFQAALAGTTGIDGFDDWVRELLETGYLHNHARMWFASIWIFTLRLPWVLGADFFLRHLLDADPASNTLSWRWVGGLQTQGKTYLATKENIARFTGGRFAPEGLALHAEPLNDLPVPDPMPLRTCKPHDPTLRSALLLHPEDLSPETLFIHSFRFEQIYLLNDPSFFWGQRAFNFVSSATDELISVLEDKYRAPVQSINAQDIAGMIDDLKQDNIKQVFTPYAPQGPVASWIEKQKHKFESADLSLVIKRRAWDDAFWPHATKGFFPFKEKIPKLLHRFRSS
jgi:deoxyribodipyrimidine photo-lyase